MSHLLPRQPVPPLEVSTLEHGTWRLADQHPEHFTMVVFYRGLHCGICSRYLADLERKLDAFKERGVEVIAISSDTEERARQSKEKWQLPNLTIGYGLDLDTADAWGLYISTSRGMTSAGVEEPKLYSEPGLFLVQPDGKLYFATVQTMPFTRPAFADLLNAVDFVTSKDYPARGEVVDYKQAAA
jgi:peroxiredoxin